MRLGIALLREQLFDVLDMRRRYRDFAIETAGARRRLVLHQVVPVRLTASDLAGTSDLKAFDRAAVRFHLGHDGCSFESGVQWWNINLQQLRLDQPL